MTQREYAKANRHIGEAWEDGKTVQFSPFGHPWSDWDSSYRPTFADPDVKWRIKSMNDTIKNDIIEIDTTRTVKAAAMAAQPAYQAWLEGKPIQYAAVSDPHWRDYRDSGEHPAIGKTKLIWRVKPTQKLRPWTMEEVPLNCWLRTYQGDNNYKWQPVTIQPRGVTSLPAELGYSLGLRTWEFLALQCEHSTDGGKTWHPCGVME